MTTSKGYRLATATQDLVEEIERLARNAGIGRDKIKMAQDYVRAWSETPGTKRPELVRVGVFEILGLPMTPDERRARFDKPKQKAATPVADALEVEASIEAIKAKLNQYEDPNVVLDAGPLVLDSKMRRVDNVPREDVTSDEFYRVPSYDITDELGERYA